MHRSLFPLLLASLGFLLIPFAAGMPLFEWQISEIVTDFPSTYQVEISPSPWNTSLEDALMDGSYILQQVRVIGNGSFCRKENLKFAVKHLRNDEIVERVLNPNVKNVFSWLLAWGMIELILSGIYIWWFISEYSKRRFVDLVIFTGIAGFFCIFLVLFWRLVGPRLGYIGIADCYGTIAFHARLSKVHYETLLVRFALILSELGAMGVMVRQIRRAKSEGKESSKSAVG